MKKNKFKIIVLLVTITVVFLTIGFSTFQSSFVMEDLKSIVRIQKDLRITGIYSGNPVSNALSNWEDYDVNKISSSLSLPNSNSSITYYVTVTNLGNVEAGIQDITGLPSNLIYSISNYTLNDTLCDDNDNTVCKLGTNTTLEITIEYAPNSFDSNNTDFIFEMDFEFFYIDHVARIGANYYDTLQTAINNVPTTNVQTTVVLLKNTSEAVTVNANQNILFDFSGCTLSNNGNNNVIKNYGTLTINNGTISSSATQGAINNYGDLYVSGGSILATGTRQAIYNDGGNVTISGTAYLKSTTDQRATVQNLANSNLTILGGSIISEGFAAVVNNGTLLIGNQDGNVNYTFPLMQGNTYGVSSLSGFEFYDGIMKGKTDYFDTDPTLLTIEANYEMLYSHETIDGQRYQTASLAHIIRVLFNPNGGTTDESYKDVREGSPIGELPTATRTDYVLDGWYTERDNGRKIDSTEIINATTEFFAHWIHQSQIKVCQIGNTGYHTLADAVNDVPTNGNKTKITLLMDVNENMVVPTGKNIELDLNNYTLSSTSGTTIENSGTLEIENGSVIRNGTNDQARAIENKSSGIITITSGTIKSNSFQTFRNYGTVNMTGGSIIMATNIEQGTFNNESGSTFNMSGGTITGTKRQAIYNDGGTLRISGSAYLESAITGTDKVRATVQNNKGTTIITGGTIISTSTRCPAVINNATMTIGTNDGVISTTSPVIQGKNYGLKISSGKTVNFYDGIIRGGSSYDAIDDESRVVTDTANNVSISHSTETIDGISYKTAYLEAN